MKLQTLKNKLAKLNIKTSVIDLNGFNQILVFTLNSKCYEAEYNTGSNEIESYSYLRGYDVANQESFRSFFDSFNQVLRHSK